MRVIVCDDHPVYRDGLQVLLEELGVDVVGAASCGEDAVTMADELAPDVVVMDLRMDGISGIEATRRITTRHPEIAVLVLTMLDDDAAVFAALRAGARGYLLKGAGHADVQRALDAISRGDTLLTRAAADRLRHGLPETTRTRAFPRLTDRETEILQLMARGRSNDQIARALFLSPKTVRNNASMILAKLGAANRGEAIVLARDAGLGQPT